jgi:superfamily II DNA/RNA helicase
MNIPFVIDNQQHKMADVLSEGQNLQDCGVLINYDLHWNPTRMVQRAGRIDRIGTSFDTLWALNMFPDEGLEKLLGLVESLSQKIESISSTIEALDDSNNSNPESQSPVKREDLKLICFDYIWQ